MIPLVFFFLISLQILTITCQDCVSHGIFTPEQFTTNLGNILADPSTPIEPLCARLGTRTQALWTPDDPNTLNKRGIFWTFATGDDVTTEWLQFAQGAEGVTPAERKRNFAEKVLHHVGFNDSDFNLDEPSNRYHMVVFDFDMMDGTWQELGKQSFMSVWDDMFDYLAAGFKVCHNPKAAYPGGNTETTNDMCEDGVISISTDARSMIKTMNWYELTGCPGGYPDHAEVHRDYASCMAGCKNDPKADEYCLMANITTPVSYGGSINCAHEFENSKPGTLTTRQEALWARVWFEKCMGCNPWFTGIGKGYDPTLPATTGTEHYVRGDVNLEKLGPGKGIDIWP